MTENAPPIKDIRPLRNVKRLALLIEEVRSREFGQPGMAVFAGPAGFGKTSASSWCAVEFQAVSLTMDELWSKKTFCTKLAIELGLKPKGTIADIMDAVKYEIAVRDVPVLIDEADVLVRKNMIEMARALHDGTECPVILIGEEELGEKLQKFERVHSRILRHEFAEPGDLGDLNVMAELHLRGIAIEDDLKEAILKASAGSLRRMVNNLVTAKRIALKKGLDEVGLTAWGKTEFNTGRPPVPRYRRAPVGEAQ